MAEIEPPPKPEKPPKKIEGGGGGPPGEPPEITEAKEVIKSMTSENEAVRKEAIEKFNLRNPPEGSLEDAKKVLISVSLDEIKWLITDADKIQHSPEVAIFVARIAKNGELRDDPRWLLARTVELAYSAQSGATTEARGEINEYVAKVGVQLRKLMKESPDLSDGINETSFDEAMYGSSPLVPSEANIFKE
ncbi:hypothetical protein MUP56_02685 [Patescibacteria group bacterium]|nr:hypothetical protein [Patescibacteria group bacterium]